jgi:hypothetical protein
VRNRRTPALRSFRKTRLGETNPSQGNSEKKREWGKPEREFNFHFLPLYGL